MEAILKRQYGSVLLADVTADQPNDWDVSDATHVRVSLPCEIRYMLAMQQKGYQFVDRTLDVTINLGRLTVDFQKHIRLDPILTAGYRAEIKKIAADNFRKDRRFHVEVDYNPTLAAQIIDGWVDGLSEVWVCFYKGLVIGFLALKESNDGKSAAIHLAAVEERYRTSGAALSLYANALKTGKERGYHSITGCISSCNMAVMNLYAGLGGIFLNPRDIYVRK